MWSKCPTMHGVEAISSPSSGYAWGRGMCVGTVSRILPAQLQHGAPFLRCSRGRFDGMLVMSRTRPKAICLWRSGVEFRCCKTAIVAAERRCAKNASGATMEIGQRCSQPPRKTWLRRRRQGSSVSNFRGINAVIEKECTTINQPDRCDAHGQCDSDGRWSSGFLGDEKGSAGMGRSSQVMLVSIISSFCLANPWASKDSAALAEVFNNVGTQLEGQEYLAMDPHIQFDATTSRLGIKNDMQQFPYSIMERGKARNDVASSATSGLNYSLAAASKICQESYGFLPCSDSLGGNLALMVAYGYCLLVAAQFISNGSELLLEVMNPGLIGGLLLPILGALPDALLILVSGVGGSPQEAQQEVMVGVGVLAGSIVMLLTIGWAGSLYAGRCDLSGPEGTAEDRTLTRSLDLTGTGVTTDEQTREGAWVMVLSALPFVLVQIPLLDGHPSEGPEAAIIGAIVCAIGLVAYSVYQVAYPWLQQKRIGEARLTFLRSRALQKVAAYSGYRRDRDSSQRHFLGSSTASLKEVFSSFDLNEDGKIQKDELAGLLVGLGLEEEGAVPDNSQIQLWLQEFDLDSDGMLTEHEFTTGITKWADKISKEKWSKTLQRLGGPSQASHTSDFWAAQSDEAKKVLDLLESEAGGEEDEEAEETAESLDAGAVKRKAAVFLAGGAALAAIFADPLVDAIGGFSTASGIPPFFVAFVVTPFASNASELVSSLIFAKGRKKKNISLTFSQLYGGVTMNNTLCLGIFLTLVYIRGLKWDFSSEVTVILTSVVIMGALGGSRTTFPLWLALPVLAIYPFCISVVALLDNFLGWH